MKIMAWVLIFFSCVAFSLSFFNLYQVFSHPMKFENEIKSSANEFNLSPALVASVINVESSFKVNARSKKDALGLMQIKLATANYLCELKGEKNLNEEELYKPEINIKFGCEYLNYLQKRFSDINTILAAYNAGETIVRSWLNSGIYSTDQKKLNYIPYSETRNYVEEINKNLKFYEKLY